MAQRVKKMRNTHDWIFDTFNGFKVMLKLLLRLERRRIYSYVFYG